MEVYSRFLLGLLERYYCVFTEQERQALAETIEKLNGVSENDEIQEIYKISGTRRKVA